MSDIMGRLASLGTMTPEIMLQVLGMIIDGIGTGEEWAGENLDQLGEHIREEARAVLNDKKVPLKARKVIE